MGSELIQKYLGDGPKLVREMFRLADDQVYLVSLLHCFCCLGSSRSGKYLGTDSGEGGQAPSIVFIDEIDAVGTKRYDSTSGGEREIQRTMLELLNQVTTAPPPFLYAKFSLPLQHRTLLE